MVGNLPFTLATLLPSTIRETHRNSLGPLDLLFLEFRVDLELGINVELDVALLCERVCNHNAESHDAAVIPRRPYCRPGHKRLAACLLLGLEPHVERINLDLVRLGQRTGSLICHEVSRDVAIQEDICIRVHHKLGRVARENLVGKTPDKAAAAVNQRAVPLDSEDLEVGVEKDRRGGSRALHRELAGVVRLLPDDVVGLQHAMTSSIPCASA